MKNYIKKRIKFKSFHSKLGLNFKDYYSLSNYSSDTYINGSVSLFKKNIQFSNPYWFLHSLEEIFVDEVYLFEKSDEDVLILDCGANIGLSIIYLKNLFKNAKFIAFEPDKSICNQLERNLKTFDIKKDVELINAAAWINEDDLTFFSEGSLGGKIINEDNKHPNNTVVKAVRLKKYIENKKIFFLKIDIEGAEHTVLEDIKDNLQNVENLFIEFHNTIDEKETLADILSWVSEAGFKYYIKEAWNNIPHPFTQINVGGGFHMQLNIFCFRKND